MYLVETHVVAGKISSFNTDSIGGQDHTEVWNNVAAALLLHHRATPVCPARFKTHPIFLNISMVIVIISFPGNLFHI